MDVEVHGLSGNLLCCLEVQAAQTVADLKELIHKATQIKTNLQKLLLGNELLRNTDSCGEILTRSASHSTFRNGFNMFRCTARQELSTR